MKNIIILILLNYLLSLFLLFNPLTIIFGLIKLVIVFGGLYISYYYIFKNYTTTIYSSSFLYLIKFYILFRLVLILISSGFDTHKIIYIIIFFLIILILESFNNKLNLNTTPTIIKLSGENKSRTIVSSKSNNYISNRETCANLFKVNNFSLSLKRGFKINLKDDYELESNIIESLGEIVKQYPSDFGSKIFVKDTLANIKDKKVTSDICYSIAKSYINHDDWSPINITHWINMRENTRNMLMETNSMLDMIPNIDKWGEIPYLKIKESSSPLIYNTVGIRMKNLILKSDPNSEILITLINTNNKLDNKFKNVVICSLNEFVKQIGGNILFLPFDFITPSEKIIKNIIKSFSSSGKIESIGELYNIILNLEISNISKKIQHNNRTELRITRKIEGEKNKEEELRKLFIRCNLSFIKRSLSRITRLYKIIYAIERKSYIINDMGWTETWIDWSI
ncbi:hypothetical protein (mitochondrion) [Myxobolus squamalis]|uniref:Uncharacterized protein n=1 Tax=Myxobolus squamalis TaxID=59785 RepID=A0A678XC78_MYXSQ|nr:hypothetical protein [Myxobolus squamalis]